MLLLLLHLKGCHAEFQKSHFSSLGKYSLCEKTATGILHTFYTNRHLTKAEIHTYTVTFYPISTYSQGLFLNISTVSICCLKDSMISTSLPTRRSSSTHIFPTKRDGSSWTRPSPSRSLSEECSRPRPSSRWGSDSSSRTTVTSSQVGRRICELTCDFGLAPST